MMRKAFSYKGLKINAFGIPQNFTPRRRRIKKNKTRSLYNTSFDSPFKKDAPKDLIVFYDIPHDLKKERDWFRRQLIKFDYVMIQKSVWVGPSPLPKEFVAYLKEIKIGDNLKTFKLAKSYK